MRAVMLINPTAHRGRARSRLDRVRDRVDSLGADEVETTGELEGDAQIVQDALASGVRLFIAAGGDGTVHSVVNALWRASSGAVPKDVVLGAIGLGSSNDFHKPTERQIPTRLDWERPEQRDVVHVSYGSPSGPNERVFVASASLGVTAEANALFNREDAMLRRLKRSMTDLAIPYAALRTMFSFRDIPATLRVDDEELTIQLSNLSVLKTPFVSGSLKFDVPVAPDDGALGVTLCDGMTRMQLVRTMIGLYRGVFSGRPRTRTWQAHTLSVTLARPAPLELDGEIVLATDAIFRVHPQWLTVCGI